MTGFVSVNKAEGVSSAREVAVIKRLTKTPCGHMGTLDPMASGVLPIGVGNATRLFDYFLTKTKKYRATFIFGEDYDTLDTTGSLLKSGGRVPAFPEVEKACAAFKGEVLQVPPRYSAKSVGGRRGYELARAGVEFELQPKKVTIYSVKPVSFDGAASYTFDIVCGGGTYVRSIARDMAASLNTFAAMSALIRTASGVFTIENSVRSDNLSEENIGDFIIPCDKVIDFDKIEVCGAEERKLLNGVSVHTDLVDGTYKLYIGDGSFYGLCRAENGVLKVRTKLC